MAAATRAIVANGIDRGDRVAIWAPNCAEWVVAALGVVGAGALLVPLNTRCKGAEAAYILRESGARLLFTVQGFLGTDYPEMLGEATAAGEKVPDLERVVVLRTGDGPVGAATVKGDPVVDWEVFLLEGGLCSADVAAGRTASITAGDLSDLVFTSGTTGRPKGAMTTHGQTLRTFATWSEIVGLREGDRYLIVNPFFHTFGYKAGILACLMTGATMVPEPVFDVDVLLRRIQSEHISVLPGPPTIFQAILDHPDRKEFDLSSLRLVVTGAAVVPVELVRSLWSDLGIETVLTAYGLTEATGTVTMCRRGDSAEVISGTSGRAIPDVSVQIVDPGGAELPRGEAGEIVVRGYNVMRGYFNDAEATDQAIDRAGWLHTGDIGVMDPAGNVTITDRLKDMFVSRRVQRLPGRGGGRPAPASRRRAGGGGGRARPPDGGGGAGRGGAGRSRCGRPDRGRTTRVGGGAPGQLQGVPDGGADRRGAARQRQRQGPQTGAARPLRRPDHRRSPRPTAIERGRCHARHRLHR